MGWTAAVQREETAVAAPVEVSRSRRRWYRVRVQTDEGPYVGSLRLDTARPSLRALRDLVEEDRAYLSLWNVTREGSGVVEGYMALHKGAVRFVVLLEPTRSPGAGGEN